MLTDNRGKVTGMESYKLELLLDAVAQLEKIGRVLHERYEDMCNGDTPAEDLDAEGNDLVAAQLQRKADAIAANVGLYIYHQTDPRGWPLYISYAPIADADYDTEAVAINCHLDGDGEI